MASSPVPSVAPVTPPIIHSLVTIKLSSENYLLWKAQIMPYLRGQRLFGYVDGSCLQPSQHIPNPEADKSPTASRLLLNPEFSHWFDQDQIVLSILMSSLSESILAKVIGVTTSREVWCALEKMYSSHSRARLSTTRRQLSTVTKGGMSISDYFQTVKSLADILVAIGHPLLDTEIVSYLLGGLDSSYDPIVTSIQTREDPIELEDIFGHLLTFELRLQQHTQVLEATIGSANVANRTDYSRGPHGKTQYSNRASSYSGSRGRGRGRGGHRGSPGGNRPMCQICGKAGHLAIKCFNRFDQAYQTMPNTMSAFFTAQQAPADTNWYPDTGSTNHLTNDLQNLNLHAETYAASENDDVTYSLTSLTITSLIASQNPVSKLSALLYCKQQPPTSGGASDKVEVGHTHQISYSNLMNIRLRIAMVGSFASLFPLQGKVPVVLDRGPFRGQRACYHK
ncbi:hypothetical protein F0562_007399 [Nyssa sinensis]|uniref:CCHC-type domain-containing protein n=1 Tax=Nyssa sinensis TaxID=561372 RepID=A0A5J5A6C5_9ASTE|nr:hypothetical protein F0562_007399 [Nyssa sinensis]